MISIKKLWPLPCKLTPEEITEFSRYRYNPFGLRCPCCGTYVVPRKPEPVERDTSISGLMNELWRGVLRGDTEYIEIADRYSACMTEARAKDPDFDAWCNEQDD